jgi:hypothetical protein
MQNKNSNNVTGATKTENWQKKGCSDGISMASALRAGVHHRRRGS